jgi:hypothetical protein
MNDKSPNDLSHSDTNIKANKCVISKNENIFSSFSSSNVIPTQFVADNTPSTSKDHKKSNFLVLKFNNT